MTRKGAVVAGLLLLVGTGAEAQQKASAHATIVITATIQHPTRFDVEAARAKALAPTVSLNPEVAKRRPAFEIDFGSARAARPASREIREEHACDGWKSGNDCRLVTVTVTSNDF